LTAGRGPADESVTRRRKLLVTGAGGMVGSYVRRAFVDYELVLTDITAGSTFLDVRDPAAMRSAIVDGGADAVLHLAAATDVDRCEQEPDWAYGLNAIGTQNVTLACQVSAIPLVYVSTGAVFPGDNAEPYTELDPPAPANGYARSKRAGEQFVDSLLQRYYIVRAGWMFGGAGRDVKFVGKITRLIQSGRTRLEAVDDLIGSPTYAADLLAGICRLMETGAYGVYHMANAGWCTRYESALAIRDALDRADVEIVPVSSDHFPLPAPRRSEALCSVKLEGLGIRMRPWQEALREYVLTELAAPVRL
jgi:dTDP-4-dehydrorhamnose reductase